MMVSKGHKLMVDGGWWLSIKTKHRYSGCWLWSRIGCGPGWWQEITTNRQGAIALSEAGKSFSATLRWCAATFPAIESAAFVTCRICSCLATKCSRTYLIGGYQELPRFAKTWKSLQSSERMLRTWDLDQLRGFPNMELSPNHFLEDPLGFGSRTSCCLLLVVAPYSQSLLTIDHH